MNSTAMPKNCYKLQIIRVAAKKSVYMNKNWHKKYHVNGYAWQRKKYIKE